MTEGTTPEPQLNRAGRRAQSRRLRKTGALMAAIPAAFGTTAMVIGATTTSVGAATTWNVNDSGDAGDGTCDVSDCTLRDAIDESADGDTIVFDAGISGDTITLTGGSLRVEYAITIDGAGSDITVNGGSSDRIFYIDLVGTSSTVTITGLTLTSGSTSSRGGAIYDEDADLVLTDVTMSSNLAHYGGALWAADGAGIDITITGSTFTENTAEIDGGAIGTGGISSLAVSGSTFTDNTTAKYDGGAIAVGDLSGAITVTDSTFTGNTALGYVVGVSYVHGGYGGAIYVGGHDGAFTITGSTFTDNEAAIDGGAVFDNSGASLGISGTTFTENSVRFYDGGAVGANSQIVTITDSTFTGNTTADQGGALYLDGGEATITNSTFSGNVATGFEPAQGDGAAVAVRSGTSLSIEGSTFTDNTAYSDAGGLFVDDDELVVSISGSVFTGNEATFYDGAAIAVDAAASVEVSFTTIADNVAGDQGGAIYLDDVYGAVTIRNSTISGNQALQSAREGGEPGYGDGGGIFVLSVLDGVTIENSTISGNTALGDSGAIFLSNWYLDEGFTGYTSGLSVIQSTITANVGTTIGGIAIVPDNFQILGASTRGDHQADRTQGGNAGAAADEGVGVADVANPTTVILNGAIVALNSGIDVGQAGTVQAASSLFGSIVGSTLVDGGGNLVGVDPLLGPLQDNGGPTQTHALLDGSPAINAGPDPVATFPGNDDDQRGAGYPRVIGGRVDIGAFEVQPTNIEPTFTG